MAEQADKDLTENWEKGIDVLLVYAALFSSVLASFLSQSFALAQPNPSDFTNTILLQYLRDTTSTGPDVTIPKSQSSTATLWINALWFASLICSLSASFFAMLARQWIQEYKGWMSSHVNDVRAKARLRHFRHLGIQQWRVSTVIWTLPFILHLSLTLFFAGLVLFSFQAHLIVGTLSALLVALTLTVYTTTIILPLVFAQCPFKTPHTQPLQNFCFGAYRQILQLAAYFFSLIPAPTHLQVRSQQHLALAANGSQEAQIVNTSEHTLDVQVFATLISTSWDASHKLIATALPSLKVESQGTRDILRATNIALLLEERYLALLRLDNNAPHLLIALGSEQDAHTYLRALLYLCESDAVPRDWWPTKRLRTSLQSCDQIVDRNERTIILDLRDRLEGIHRRHATEQGPVREHAGIGS